jgi:hypothetical protein
MMELSLCIVQHFCFKAAIFLCEISIAPSLDSLQHTIGVQWVFYWFTMLQTNPLSTSCGVEEEDEVEADGANYQLEMMRCLREVNVDNNTVGCYQSTYMGSFQTVELIETFLNYQQAEQRKLVQNFHRRRPNFSSAYHRKSPLGNWSPPPNIIVSGTFPFRQSGSESRKVDTAARCYVQGPCVLRCECATSQRLLGL